MIRSVDIIKDGLHGRLGMAPSVCEKAQRIFGEGHADVATSNTNLALVYNRLGQYNRGKDLHEKALMIRKRSFGEGHADVATSYTNLALVYNRLGQYNQAKDLHEKALMICKRIFGEDHADLASSKKQLGISVL